MSGQARVAPSLRLQRLRVVQLRQFREPMTLDHLAAGLNIFSGPNEAGKSTLVRALRAAFFERHRSTAVDDLRPWGDSAAAPTVELDFDWGGERYQLSKSFLAKKRCNLQVGARHLEGVEAEDHLAQLFGFQFAGKGASKEEHWGIPGLLWVEQGTGQELRSAQGHAREHLHQALQGLGAGSSAHVPLGAELAASGGDALLTLFRTQRAELLTATGKPRGDLSEAGEQVQRLQAGLADCQARLSEERAQVDRLAALRAEQARDEQQRPWDALTVQLQEVQQRRTALADTERLLASQTQRQQQLEQQRQWQAQQLAGWQQQTLEGQRRREVWQQAEQQVQQTEQQLQAARERLQWAQDQAQAARETLRQARLADTRRTLEARCAQTEAETRRLQAALAQAQAAQSRSQALKAQRAAVALEEAALKRWRRAEAELAQLHAQREAAATRLSYQLLPGSRVVLQDEQGEQALGGAGDWAITGPTRLSLPGLGELQLQPGGQDLATLGLRREQLAGQLQAEMAAVGLADLPAAEARWAQWQDLQQQVLLAEQALQLVAPQGLAALQSALDEAQAQHQTATAALASPAIPGPDAPTSPLLSLSTAEAADEAASRRAQQLQGELQQVQTLLARQTGDRDGARREHDAVQAALLAPERAERQRQAEVDVLATAAEWQAVAAQVGQLREQVAAARPDILAQDEERLARSIEQLTLAHRQRHETILLLERDLAHAGAEGLDEQLQTTQGELSRAREREGQLHRRARALDLLVTRLEAGRQASLTRMQAPLQRHLDHYVDLLFPGARLAVDEQLAPGLLSRPGVGPDTVGSFEALSFGAREQLGLISRFAYADLLREAGRPTLLILDDALVHSDEQRLAQMKRVVFDAAQRHQLLLFTCHPSAWRDMGVPVRDLLAVRQGLR